MSHKVKQIVTMIRLSVTSKLDGIKSWSLQAGTTCPGSKDADACAGCYALSGNYNFPNVKAIREYNKKDWTRKAWVNDMVQALETSRYFRWFDSGDIYSLSLANKIYDVMRLTPHCSHWLPTRMHKFNKFMPILNAMKLLDNVMVRFSSDSINGTYTEGLHGSVIIPTHDYPTVGKVCDAYQHEGKCSGCRACWDKSVPLIAYPAHGAMIKKIIRLQLV